MTDKTLIADIQARHDADEHDYTSGILHFGVPSDEHQDRETLLGLLGKIREAAVESYLHGDNSVEPILDLLEIPPPWVGAHQ